MSNIWSLFQDYEKRYHGWLKDSAVPATTKWYQGSGIDEKLESWKTGLLGEQQWDPSGTKRVGGSLETAGGVIKDYVTRPNVRTMHPTEGVIVGKQLQSPFQRDIAQTGVKALEVTKDIVKSGVDAGNQALEWAFPNANWAKTKSSISSDDKAKLSDMMKSGKIDHGFVNALKKKTSPLDNNELSGIEKLIGMSKEDVAKQWKDKGGFEGLMSNPGFTLGLALMQSSAEGKTIGGGIMDNFISAAKLSEHYKDRIDARTQVLGPPTKEERELADAAMMSIGISGPGWGTKAWDFVKIWGNDNEAAYNAGLNKIIIKSKEIIRKKYRGKKHQITEQDYIDAFKKLEDSKELGSVENIFGVGIKDMKLGKTKKKSKLQQWIEDNFAGKDSVLFRAEGGPVPAGQPTVVGEKGPEVIVPKTDVNVISNDDSQVMGMLLASNPQLQNVSKARAESILRSRFPDYFA